MSDKLLAEWFWTDRWMGSSGFLLPLESRGLYREMLTQAWRRGARLPNDPEAIRRATGTTTDEWARCWPQVAPYWRVDGDALVNDTQAEVYADTKARVDRESDRGRKGGKASAERRRHGNSSSTQVSTQVGTQAEHKHHPPSPSPYKIKSKEARTFALVSASQHAIVVQEAHDAAGQYANGLDYAPIYQRASEEWAQHGSPADKLADLKKRARLAALQRKDVATYPTPGAEATRAYLDKLDAGIKAVDRTSPEWIAARDSMRRNMAGSR